MEAQKSSSVTTVETVKIIQFKAKPQSTVKWSEDTKDNEGLGKKKSKGILRVLEKEKSLLHF